MLTAIAEISRQNGVTKFMTVWQPLLRYWRIHGRGRHRGWVADCGSKQTGDRRSDRFFLNTLVLRADLSGNPSFSELSETGARSST